MDKAKIEFEIQQLTDLQNICNQLKADESFKQNNQKLLDVLKEQYKLSAEDVSAITAVVEGKAKATKQAKADKPVDKKTLQKKFDSYCILLDISLKKRNGEILGYTEVSIKCSNKKSLLKKKLDEQQQ